MPVERLEVAHAGQPTYTLSFSAATGLLAKIAARVPDGDGKRLVDEEVFYRDWRKVGALLYPHEQISYRDGNLIQEAKATKLEFLDQLEPALFARPKP